jgi:peroxiredoxin
MGRMTTELPEGLPVPVDDGAADHLTGCRVPAIGLPGTDGRTARLDRGPRRTIVYAYPRTARPGEDPLVPDWDLIPGARGCTAEACDFRDHYAELRGLGADVYGLSTQHTDDQREVAGRLDLPFALLSDADLRLTQALRLPTLEVAGLTLLKRHTLAIRDGMIEHVWYPVFPPNLHADEVVTWLRGAPL